MNKQLMSGILFVIAAPSGGGKTSLVDKLLKSDPQLKLSISHTTRPMRAGEVHGKHYFFVKPDVFDQMVKKEEFLEHATVFGASYGTSSQQVMNFLQEGIDVVLEIDWQGARQVRQLFDSVVSIFILPPSYEVLAKRLSQRGQDTEAIISARMEKAHNEIIHCNEFDFIVFNDEFDVCLQQLQAIILSERLRYKQQSWRNAARLSRLLEPS
jgi:guanylate kinase